MKINKYADHLKGKEGTVKTSGGGNFEGYIGGYDKESNTIDVWNGFSRTKIDADKIVSYNVKSPFLGFVIILAFIGVCFVLLDIIKPSNRGNYRNDNYYGDRYDRQERAWRNR